VSEGDLHTDHTPGSRSWAHLTVRIGGARLFLIRHPAAVLLVHRRAAAPRDNSRMGQPSLIVDAATDSCDRWNGPTPQRKGPRCDHDPFSPHRIIEKPRDRADGRRPVAGTGGRRGSDAGHVPRYRVPGRGRGVRGGRVRLVAARPRARCRRRGAGQGDGSGGRGVRCADGRAGRSPTRGAGSVGWSTPVRRG
jgi:hypothetical protein